CVSALYLFGRYDQLNTQEIEQIKTVLLRQKKRVAMYTDSRPEYVLASGSVSLAISWFGDFLKIMRHYDYIDFIIPSEGLFAEVASFVMPATSTKIYIIIVPHYF